MCREQVTLPDDIVRSKVFYLEPTTLEAAIEQIDLVRAPRWFAGNPRHPPSPADHVGSCMTRERRRFARR